MIETMYLSRGVGLAAPQVGVNARVAVIDVSPDRDSPMVLVEPRIVERSGSMTEEEGCLSVPGVNGRVRRSARVVVEHEDLEGATCRVEAEGLLARVLQHEVDHLDGKLFIDRLGMAKRLAIRRHLSRLEAAARRREAGAEAAGEEPT
jgi:peptide deformylase